MSVSQAGLLADITAWLEQEPRVKSAVLFGSSARAPEGAAKSAKAMSVGLISDRTEKVLGIKKNAATVTVAALF